MTFHSPIDEAQWQFAKRTYKGLRASLRALRRDHAPRTVAEHRMLAEYLAIIQKFGRELLKPRGKMSAALLNDSSKEALRLFVNYVEARKPGD
jgi:hypothetical protein